MDEKFELEVLTRLAVIENKLDDYKQIKQKSEDAYNLSKNNKEELNEMKERTKWLRRAVLSSLITALIGVLTLFIKI